MIRPQDPNSISKFLNFQELYSKLLTLKNNIRDVILVKEQTVFIIQMGVCVFLWEREGGGGAESSPRNVNCWIVEGKEGTKIK